MASILNPQTTKSKSSIVTFNQINLLDSQTQSCLALVPMVSKGISLKEGWLTKQGNYIKNWRPRWFQVREGILIYYKEPTVEAKPTNFFVLAGCTAHPYDKIGPGCFELIMSNGEKRQEDRITIRCDDYGLKLTSPESRYMQASSKAERDDWIRVLHEASSKRPLSVMMGDSSRPENIDIATYGETVPGFKGEKLTPDDFNFLKVLGKGNYGKVMLATLKEGDGRSLAVKVIKKSSLVDEESLEHVLSENRVLQTLKHPFLVKLYCSFQTEDRLYFVMEYVSGGELFFHIGREKRFGEDRVRFYAAEILLALNYLHQKGIVYRDLKLENLLLDKDGHIKITDFGLVKEGIGYNDVTSTFCGTPEYLAPEILEEETYGKSVDWWALGVVMYELSIGRPPFGPANNMEKLFFNILHQPISIPATLSEDAKSILENLLNRDCNKRLGCSPLDGLEVMRHPYFRTIHWNRMMNKEISPPFKPQIQNSSDVGNFDKEFTQMPAILTPVAAKFTDTHDPSILRGEKHH